MRSTMQPSHDKFKLCNPSDSAACLIAAGVVAATFISAFVISAALLRAHDLVFVLDLLAHVFGAAGIAVAQTRPFRLLERACNGHTQ